MGLFGGLFDKKACSVCGGEIGLLGNRKLEDGNLCKNCASRLSPWFSERRHSTVYEIEQQLAYREANYDRVRAFVPTRAFGEYECLFMDDNMQAFTVTVPNGLSRGDRNPDIVDYAAYVSIKPEIREHRWEDHHGPEDPNRPPRFRYDYDFYITIYVNHPYFDDIHCKLNVSSVRQENWNECMRFVSMTEDAVEAMSGVRPDLSMSIRYPEPEVIPIPMSRPVGGPMPHGGPAPVQHVQPGHPHPVQPSVSQGRPVQSPGMPQPRPQAVQTGVPQGRPAPAPQPARPAQPAQPARPGQPAQGARPAQPAQPTRPGQPAQGARPVQTAQGTRPAQPARPGQPAQGTRPAQPARPGQQNTPGKPGGPSGAGRGR